MKNIYIYRINTGSCNACDVELLAGVFVPKFGFENLGFSYTNDPTQANILLVTGPITVRSSSFLTQILSYIPQKKVVVAIGICPISGGIFRDSYAIAGSLDNFVKVDINIAGCPPSPTAMIQGLIHAKKIWDKLEDSS